MDRFASVLPPVLSKSESERFGISVGRITVESVDGLRLAEHSVRDGVFALVIVRVLAQTVWSAGPDVEIVDCGISVTYEGRVDACNVTAAAGRGTVALRRIERWGPAETKLVEQIFAGYRNHVAMNPRLDASQVAAGYADWSARHVDGRVPGDCYVLEERRPTNGRREPLAFAAVAPDRDGLVIDLAGVLPAHRGRGTYQLLLDTVEDVAFERGNDRVRIATQAGNRAAVRSWKRRGWKQVAEERTLHVMRSGRDGRI